jgi:putative endopeptidase
MKTNKYRKKRKQTKKNNGSILTEKEKTMKDIITEIQNKKDNNRLNNEITSIFETPFKKINLKLIKNDFFSYVNETWIKKVKLTKRDIKYLTKIDNFQITQYKTFEQLSKILENYISKNNSIVSVEMKNLWQSALNFNPLENSKSHIKHIIEHIDNLRKDKNNLWKMLAFINKNELTSPFGPFSWEVGPDKKNSQEYVNYLEPHIFAIFDMSVYYDSNFSEKQKEEYKKKYQHFFINYVTKLFHAIAPNDHTLNADSVFEIGQTFFQLFAKNDPTLKEDSQYYNKISEKEALEKYGFNWSEYCKALGYESIPEFFITSNINYFKFCTELLINEWNSEKWRPYWIWIFARYIARLTNKWHHIFYEFYGIQEKGMLGSFRSNIKHPALLFMALGFNPILNNEYIDYSFNEQVVIFSKDLAENLRNIFIGRLNRNTWLSEKTRKYSILKLDKLEINIGAKKIDWTPDMLPLLNFSPTQFIDNVLKILNWRHNIFLQKNIKMMNTIAKIDWTQYPAKITSLPSYIVNAQYVPYKNAFFVSNAYLQKPFINLNEYGIQFNLANIGFTMCHELSHALDDLGSKYDIYGNIYDWWTKPDRAKFNKIQKDLIKQYEQFAKYDNINYKADLSVGEDIADISGLSISEEYLRDFCIKNKYPPPVIYNYFRIFYVYFALQMKQKIHKESVKYELLTNPHPIDKFRTNVTLSRSPFFRAIFNIQPNDHMYWNNKEFGIF